MNKPAAILRSLVPLALGAGLSFAAQAAPVVSAMSVSGAQATQQGNTSSAYVVNGVPQAGYGAGPGGSSNVGNLGNAFSAFADTAQLDVGLNGSVQANTYAAADLTSGSLRVYAEAGPGDNPAFSSQAFGQARFQDSIIFNNTSGQNVELDFFWNTEGAITPQRSTSTRDVTSSIIVGLDPDNFSFIGMKGANGQYVALPRGAQYRYLDNGFGTSGEGFSFQPNGGDPFGVWRTSLGAGESGLIAGTLIVPTGVSGIDIDALLQVDCRSGAICDFGNTSTFSFGALPNGLSWTSESGVFLTASGPPPGTAPEPTTLALLALGLAGLGIRRRKHT